ncbi:MAG: GNAT family N-acetyltransferase [Candidatus Helarchaeota archaeon]
MSVRNIRVKDAPIVTEIANNCSPLLRASVEGTYEFLARCFSNTFFVYEKDGQIIGYTVGFPNTAKKGEFWIYQVGILEDFRSKGIGSKLFEALFNQVRKEGYECIRSHYIFSNKHSGNLHSKFGMKICGQDDRGYFVEAKFNE